MAILVTPVFDEDHQQENGGNSCVFFEEGKEISSKNMKN